MVNKKDNWLILAHCFNMDGRAASQTITDKIPFLMKKGITPIVVSAPTGIKDRKFSHHQIFSPAPSGLNFEMRKVIEKKYHKGTLSQFLKAIVTILCLPFLLVEKLIINLDSHWSWFITAGLKSTFLIKKYKPEVIYSTAGPSSTHLTGYILKRVFNIPWIAEIHDPLIPEVGDLGYQRQGFHKWLEKVIFEHANAVIYFTENACRNASQRTHIFHNAHVLRPGANPPEIKDIVYKKEDKFHMGHFGSLASGRSLSLVIEALSSVAEKDPEIRGRIILDVYGMELDTQSKKYVNQLGLGNVVKEHGRLELDPDMGKSGRLQVFEKMHLCDVLLVIHGHTEICSEYIPSKVYEYLLTKRPILGVTDIYSELGQLLTSTGNIVVENTLEEIEKTIQNLFYEWESDRLPLTDNVNRFTVENTVNKMVELTKS